MGWIIWGIVLPSCLVSAWLIVRKPLRQVVEELGFDQGRLQFRQQREWLEARFLTALGRVDPIERLRWEGAHWHDQVHWARDNQTRRLIALVEIHFEPDPFDPASGPDSDSDHATALFEYRKGALVFRRQAARRHPTRRGVPPPRPVRAGHPGRSAGADRLGAGSQGLDQPRDLRGKSAGREVGRQAGPGRLGDLLGLVRMIQQPATALGQVGQSHRTATQVTRSS